MIKTVLTTLFLVIAIQIVSQNKRTSDDDLILYAEPAPEFPGGLDSMYHFLATEIHYPDSCKKYNIAGKVYVGFTVKKDGSINDIKVLKSVHPLIDEEAIRVISKMPKWIPGEQYGKPVDVNYTIPIKFSLD